MNGKINHKISEALRQDDLEQITAYIIEICEMLVKDFTDKNRKLPNNENRIRSIMLEEYLDDDKVRNDYGMSDYSFTPETQEHYDGKGNYIGRADIRIKLKTDFDKRSAYYIIECKRIDGTSELNNKYIEEGVARFVTQKYSAYYGKNIMLGFVIKDIDISGNALKIEKIQNANDNAYMHGSFELVNKVKKHEMYKCTYYIESGELELRHIFSDFSNVVD